MIRVINSLTYDHGILPLTGLILDWTITSVTMEVKQLRKNNFDQLTKEITSWGNVERIAEEERLSIKIFRIRPHSEMHSKYYNYRSKLLKVLKGEPIIVINNNSSKARKGDNVYIPTRSQHQIMTTSSEAEILEVTYLW